MSHPAVCEACIKATSSYHEVALLVDCCRVGGGSCSNVGSHVESPIGSGGLSCPTEDELDGCPDVMQDNIDLVYEKCWDCGDWADYEFKVKHEVEALGCDPGSTPETFGEALGNTLMMIVLVCVCCCGAALFGDSRGWWDSWDKGDRITAMSMLGVVMFMVIITAE